MPVLSGQGLEDVIAAESAITWIDGAAGQLRYRGYAIGELAERCTFEEVAYLLWYEDLPSTAELDRLKHELRTRRQARSQLIELVTAAPHRAHPLDVLRYVTSWDALRNPLSWENDAASNYRKAIDFAAWFPVVTAAFHRIRHGQDPVPPRPELATAANFLWMLHGREPGQVAAQTLDTSFILHADHEFNASTFAARVTIATQSNLHAAVASALGTLAGPRHGGASDRVIQMLDEIGAPDRAEGWILGQLAQKQRIMGFGHRVYRTTDPRSRHLRAMAEKLLTGTPQEPWIEILARIATVMERERGLYPNVDLYAAVVNHALGVEPAFYTALFACSRVVGWTAHAVEQLGGRMIRPKASYTGPGPRSMVARAAL
jgi:citrate synthase